MTAGWPWSTLAMQPSADSTEVKRAYAKLLKVHRPDRDPLGFQALNEAYSHALALAGQLALGNIRYGEPFEDEEDNEAEQHKPLAEPVVATRPSPPENVPIRVAVSIDSDPASPLERLAKPSVCVIDSDEVALRTEAIVLPEPEPELAVRLGLHLTDAQANALAAETMQFLVDRAPAAELQAFLYAQSTLEDFRTRNAFAQLLLEYLASHQQAPLSASFAVLRDFFGFDARAGRDANAGNEVLVRAIALDAGQQQLEHDFNPPGWRTAEAQMRSNMLKQLLGPSSSWRMFCNALLLGRVNAYNALIYHYDLISLGQAERLLGPGRREAWAALVNWTPWTKLHTALFAARALIGLAFLACLPILAIKAPPLALFALIFALRYVVTHSSTPKALSTDLGTLFNQPKVYAYASATLALGVVLAPLHGAGVLVFSVLLFFIFVFSHIGMPSLLSSCAAMVGSAMAVLTLLRTDVTATQAFLGIPSGYLLALYLLRFVRSRATGMPLHLLSEQSRWAFCIAFVAIGIALLNGALAGSG